MKITVSTEYFLSYAAEIAQMQGNPKQGDPGSIEQYWHQERITTFRNMNGMKLEQIHGRRWKITQEFYETEEFDDGKGGKGNRVVLRDETKIVALGEGEKQGKPKKVPVLKEGKTQEMFNEAMNEFMNEPVEITV